MKKPSVDRTNCTEKSVTDPRATMSKALAAAASPRGGLLLADSEVALRMSRIVSAAVADHVTTPRRERYNLRD